MKKILVLMLMILLVLTGCTNKPSNEGENKRCDDSESCDITDLNPSDASKEFKEKYEALNGIDTKKYREIEIPENDIFVEINTDQLKELLDKPDWTGILLVSDPKCPWCRSVMPYAVQAAIDNKVDKIYAISIWDDEGNEVWRDKWKLTDGKVEKIVDGHPTYYQLMEKDESNQLSEYTFSDENKETVSTGEKRIYAPNFIRIENGKIISVITGISEYQTDSRQEISKVIENDMVEILNNWFGEFTKK